MKCERAGCPNDIEEGARQGTRFCSDVCRAAEYRRQKQMKDGAAAVTQTSASSDAIDPVAALAFGEHYSGSEPRDTEHSKRSRGKTGRKRRRSAKRGNGAVRSAPDRSDAGRERTPRIPYDQQLRSQAPDGAAGYRLVLSFRSDSESPVIIPTADVSGGLRYYRLAPLELPDDLRLRDGHSYRILWVDFHGQPLPPRGTESLPALHVFFGAPDPISTEEAKQTEDLLQNITDPELRQVFEFEAAKFRMDALRQRLEAEQVRAKTEAQLAAHRQAQEVMELTQRLALEREAATRTAVLAEQKAAHRRDVKLRKEQRKRALQAERERLIEQSAREQERRQITDSLLMMGLTVGMPILLATIALLVRSAQGLPLDDDTLDNLKKRITEAAANMAAAARPADSQSEQRAASQSQTESPSPKAESATNATSQADVVAILERLRKAHEEVIRRAKEQGSERATDPVVTATPTVTETENPSPAVVPDRPKVEQQEEVPEDVQSATPQRTDRQFRFDYFLPPTLPRNWREKGKTPTSRKECVNLYCWLQRPECLSAVIVEITNSDPEFEPDVPLLAHNDRLTADEKELVAQIIHTPKAVTFACVHYLKQKPQKNHAKLMKLVQRKYGELSAQQDKDARAAQNVAPTNVATATPTSAPVQWEFVQKFTLSEQEGALVASIITSADRLLQLDYEQQKAEAAQRGEAPPTEPILNLSADDRKRIRKLFQDEKLREALQLARQEFDKLCNLAPERLLAIPEPFESLKPQDLKMLQEVARDADRSTLFRYYLSCQECLRSGQLRPSLPETNMNGKAQKELAKLAQDRRQAAYFWHLTRKAESLD